jgi:glycerophosphoryl diester phosphodiesterase
MPQPPIGFDDALRYSGAVLRRSRLLRIAHRGASGLAPENTRASFLRAIELGADMVELDCQMTRDGAVVVIHDERLDRTTNGTGRVRDRTLREIKALDAGSWFAKEFAGEEVLTLEEAIELLRGHVELNLEIKGQEAPGRLEIQCVGVVRSLRFFSQTVFSSFSAARVRLVRDLADDARIGVLVDTARSWTEAIDFARDLGAEAMHAERSLASAATVDQAHRRDLEVRVWSVNRQPEIDALVALGVDGIFTDFPERLLRFGAGRRPAG